MGRGEKRAESGIILWEELRRGSGKRKEGVGRGKRELEEVSLKTGMGRGSV